MNEIMILTMVDIFVDWFQLVDYVEIDIAWYVLPKDRPESGSKSKGNDRVNYRNYWY